MSEEIILRHLQFMGFDWLDVMRAIDEKLQTQAARIAELQLALKAVHRHAMGRSGDRTFDQCSAALGYIDDICRAALEGGKDDGTL